MFGAARDALMASARPLTAETRAGMKADMIEAEKRRAREWRERKKAVESTAKRMSENQRCGHPSDQLVVSER